MSGHLQCLQEAYRSLNVLNERDRFGATPIHYAARHGQLECLRWLVEHSGVSPNAAARNGSTPAHDAAATGYLECLKYLLVNTKCGVHDRTVEGATVLHMACRFGREDVVCWLIDYGNASPSDKGANGVTPVHLCAAKSESEREKNILRNSKNCVVVCVFTTSIFYFLIFPRAELERGKFGAPAVFAINKDTCDSVAVYGLARRRVTFAPSSRCVQLLAVAHRSFQIHS